LSEEQCLQSLGACRFDSLISIQQQYNLISVPYNYPDYSTKMLSSKVITQSSTDLYYSKLGY